MSTKLNVAFCGCSLTRGDGFDLADQDQCYPALLQQQLRLHTENLSVSGASNHMIFLQAAGALQTGQFDMVICQWSALNRLWFSPGPQCWYYATGDDRDSFEYRDLRFDRGQKCALENMVRLLNHDYQNILTLIDYVNIVDDLADHHDCQVVHVNGLVPWTPDMANSLSNFDDLSAYTRELVDFDHRDDAEIQQLLEPLRRKFSTLRQQRWVNLWQSFHSLSTDLGPQGHHPGPQSHAHMAQLILQYITQGNS